MNPASRSLFLLPLLLIAALAATPAFGSGIIGRAHVTYRSRGAMKTLMAWGAINARAPSTARPQVRFRLQYVARGRGVCLPYDGLPLAWLIKAPDGSYWALQSWVRLEPNYGGTRGVYGFKATPSGSPLDSYGRNIYVDTFDSAYGNGWHPENSFLTHHRGRTLGDFCYGFFPHGSHPAGEGTKYRATAEGPGVTPDVLWTADDIGPFNATTQAQQQALEQSWGDPKCRT